MRSLANASLSSPLHDAAPDYDFQSQLIILGSGWEKVLKKKKLRMTNESKQNYLPRIGQGNQMIDVNIRSIGPCRPVVWTEPTPAHSRAAGILPHVDPVSLQYDLPGIAGTGLRTPVRKQVPAVAGLGALRGDHEEFELVGSGEVGRDIGRGGQRGGVWNRSRESEGGGDWGANDDGGT